MSGQIESIIALAESDIGYKESPPNSNKTKFGAWYGLDGQPWCMMAVQYWFTKAELGHLIPLTASCAALLSYAKANKQFVQPKELRRGDIVLYRFGRTGAAADHTGIITYADGKMLRAIEGNTSVGNDSDGGAVLERERTLLNVVGAYRPQYREGESLTFEQFEEHMNRYMNIAHSGEICSPWAKTATDALRARGIVSGSEGDFGWKKPVTKETVAQMLYNFMRKTEEER